MNLQQLEYRACHSDMTVDDFKDQLWQYLVHHKTSVRKFAKELNVYPTLGNVDLAIREYFFSHVNLV